MRSSSLPCANSFNDTLSSKPKSNYTLPEENHHQIDRHAVVEVICRKCYHRQSSKTNSCISCNVQFGAYHCMECNLWMAAEDEELTAKSYIVPGLGDAGDLAFGKKLQE